MHSIAWWPTILVLAVATFTDLRSRRIPNWLVLPFLLWGVGVSGWLHGWSGVGHSLAGMGTAVGIFGLFYLLGGMGMGDIKLCAAIGAWIGPAQMLLALVFTSIAGGLMALCWAVAGGFIGELFTGTGDLLIGFGRNGLRRNPEITLNNPSRRRMPYAPAIAIGTILSFFAH